MRNTLKLWALLPLAVSTLVLSSAGAQHLGTKGSLKGTVSNLPAGQSGTISVLESTKGPAVASATTDAKGQFSLTLPDYLSASLLGVSNVFTKTSNLGSGCAGKGEATNVGNFRPFYLGFAQEGKALSDLKDLTAKAGDVDATVMYFSAENSMDGYVTCPGGTDYEFSGTFPAGWSLVRTEVRAKGRDKIVVHYMGGAAVQGLSWKFFSKDSSNAVGLTRGVLSK